ncbi:hypothetical protein QJS10_CPB11g01220 [Acorus calamus]|uniref:Uncharacterized protein n=1 Tax=Acorus calamus TaxID=4465 RepID=A0AAV9DTR8_ACOCL|nr:hypothetical protein QJS10_CPB11g01220 [Acorus calamus]
MEGYDNPVFDMECMSHVTDTKTIVSPANSVSCIVSYNSASRSSDAKLSFLNRGPQHVKWNPVEGDAHNSKVIGIGYADEKTYAIDLSQSMNVCDTMEQSIKAVQAKCSRHRASYWKMNPSRVLYFFATL